MFKIKEPFWGTGGCVANMHFNTPEGWLGIREEHDGYVVVGVTSKGWQNIEYFSLRGKNKEGVLEEAKKYTLNIYYEQVKKWLDVV